jgi:hypothetical protein
MARFGSVPPILAGALAILSALFAQAGCDSGKSPAEPDAWPRPAGRNVYTVAMEGRKDVLLFAASPRFLTVAYDTALCGALLAWKGPVQGDEYNADAGFQPAGPVYFRQKAARLWTVRNGQDTLAAATGSWGSTRTPPATPSSITPWTCRAEKPSWWTRSHPSTIITATTPCNGISASGASTRG